MGSDAIDRLAGSGSCEALGVFRSDVDQMMSDILCAALAVKEEQGFAGNAVAFDYTVSFLSGLYRAIALLARDATIEAMS